MRKPSAGDWIFTGLIVAAMLCGVLARADDARAKAALAWASASGKTVAAADPKEVEAWKAKPADPVKQTDAVAKLLPARPTRVKTLSERFDDWKGDLNGRGLIVLGDKDDWQSRFPSHEVFECEDNSTYREWLGINGHEAVEVEPKEDGALALLDRWQLPSAIKTQRAAPMYRTYDYGYSAPTMFYSPVRSFFRGFGGGRGCGG